jgi:hypothetical protein
MADNSGSGGSDGFTPYIPTGLPDGYKLAATPAVAMASATPTVAAATPTVAAAAPTVTSPGVTPYISTGLIDRSGVGAVPVDFTQYSFPTQETANVASNTPSVQDIYPLFDTQTPS